MNETGKPDLPDACFGCMKKECKAHEKITAKDPLSSVLRQALAALVPPALGFAAGFFLIRRFFPEASEGACAAAGVVLLFVSAFVVYAVRKRKSPDKGHTIC